jgi:hypothetical protein
VKAVRIQSLKKECFALWSKYIRQRDGHKCALCGATKYVTAHHWCLPKRGHADFMFEEDNGVALCYMCHIRKIHREDSSFALISRVKNYILTVCAHPPTTSDKINSMISVYGTDSGDSVSEEALAKSKAKLVVLLKGKAGCVCKQCARALGAKCQTPPIARDICCNCAETAPLYGANTLNWNGGEIPPELVVT